MERLRPKGSVELECTMCGWTQWYDPLSPEVQRVMDSKPHVCGKCQGEPEPTEKG